MVAAYLLIINALAFLFMLVDKHRARKNKWRIPESRLLLTAILGGSVGTLAGMYLARHKTKHPKFTIGVPLILAVQILMVILLFAYFCRV